MYATIKVSPYIFVQGRVLRELPSGAIAVDFRGCEIIGAPVATTSIEQTMAS